jgi:hypothetical protein
MRTFITPVSGQIMKTLSILVSAALVSASVLAIGLVNRASAESPNTVVAVCGSNGAVQIVDADKVPVGCHVSKVNLAPNHH